MDDAKQMLHDYLRSLRERVLWKVEGLSERDLRWPHTPTGTNLLGVVKHLAGIELDYFGVTFGRPAPVSPPWLAEDAEDNADMWATADESAADVIGLYRLATEHADATIEALDLGSAGNVPWWRAGDVTLHQILVHVIAETAQHAGHMDIVRDLVDGSVGLRQGATNIPGRDEEWWRGYVARLRQVAEEVGG
ncbi:MAG TPA: DinB family protein [Actinomycetaceae bacterium]|nr:DinB family protein [Actinomycetaceae bacterium]